MKYLRILCLICALTVLSACTKTIATPISRSGFYFDTIISITIYDSNDSSLLNDCFNYCQQFENQLSRTIKDSEISRINSAKGQPVEVSDTTIALIQTGLYYSELTNGAFDITVAPLTNLWNFKGEEKKIPSSEAINNALSHVGYEKIVIENNTVTLTDPDAAIDLGGIAKGYMADFLKEYLISQGVKKALINLGGNILTVGTKPDNTPFNIGIQKPFADGQTPITAVSAKDLSVVTSGIYERYFQVDSDIYHHILDTDTGYPCKNNLYSVTILSEKSVDGDALSTACYLLGLEDGIKLIQSIESVEAIFITDNFEIIDTRK